MKRLTTTLLLIAALIASAGCPSRSSPTEPESRPALVTLSLSMETTHFVLLYSEQDTGKMEAYAAALETSHSRITRDLNQPNLPTITGRFYPDEASYEQATGWPSGGSVQGPTVFSVVASPLRLSMPVHEFAHNVALNLDPTCDNNPTWLWEATAVWEAEEFVDPATVPCLAGGDFPTLAELNQRGGDCDIYRVGYTLGELIVERWGRAELRDLIRAHGNTDSVLGLSTEEFESTWQEFVEERYL